MISTFFTLLVGYPIAYGMARAPAEWRPTLMMLVILPFWTSFLIRVYAWMGILSNEGFLNQFLLWTGRHFRAADHPQHQLRRLYRHRLHLSAVHDPADLFGTGAAGRVADRSGRGPGLFAPIGLLAGDHSAVRPGIIAGSFLVFIPVLGEFVIPSLLGGSDTLMIGKVLWEEFFSNRDWPVASAVAVVLLLILVIPIVLFQRNQQKQQEAEQ